MRCTLSAVILLAACSLVAADDQSANGQAANDLSAVLGQANQAFASADYKTADSLYKQLDGKISDAAVQATVTDHIRFAEKQLAAEPAASAALSVAVPVSTPVVGPATQPTATADLTDMGPNRVKHVKPKAGEVASLTLHELGNFDFNEDDDKSIPADVTQMSGVHVKIPGVMFPLDQSGRVSRFLLVNDMMSCCFGTAPKLQHVAYVELPKDKWMAATTDRIVVEGTLKVEVKRDDGFVMSIFQIDPSSIKMAGQ